MPRVIHCEDGVDIRGASDEELLVAARQHMDEAHPDLDLSDEELLAMAVEEVLP